MLKVKALSINYSQRSVLDNVDLSFEKGTITVIKGESGSGKSSLLNVLGLMQTANSFKYTYNDTVISDFNEKQRADFRLNKIGFVFQQNNIINEFTAKQNLIIPMSITEKNKDVEAKAEQLLNYVGLGNVKDSYPDTLSGGEEQRLAIARAISNDAEIILADEPTAALDPQNAKIVLELFKKLAHELNKTVILVSHDKLVASYADNIYQIENKSVFMTKASAAAQGYSAKDNKEILITNGGKRKTRRFVKYYIKHRNADKVLNKVFVVLTAIVSSFAILSTNFGDNFSAQQSNLINAISDKSIFVVNNTSDIECTNDYEIAVSITQDV